MGSPEGCLRADALLLTFETALMNCFELRVFDKDVDSLCLPHFAHSQAASLYPKTM